MSESMENRPGVVQAVGVSGSDAAEGRRRGPMKWIVLLIVIMVVGSLGTWYWLVWRGYEQTDDAFIEGNVIPISARVSGQVVSVAVDDNRMVQKDQTLTVIDPSDIDARLRQAEATLEATHAKKQVASSNVALVKANTQAALAQAQAGVEEANALVNSAEAQVASVQADVTAADAEATRRQADLKRYLALDPQVVSRQVLDAAKAAADAADALLAASRKRVGAAEAQVGEAKARVARAKGVLAAAQTGPEQVLNAEAQERAAQAAVQEVQAVVEAVKLEKSYTTIVAPVAGRITRKTVQTGQYLQVGQIILAIVPQEVWIVANFKETQLTHMRPGQAVDISVDAYPGTTFHGKVDSIQAGTGARFSMLPPENATGNYVKVVQRVPVKIVLDNAPGGGELLVPGMSVVPTVKVMD